MVLIAIVYRQEDGLLLAIGAVAARRCRYWSSDGRSGRRPNAIMKWISP
jgi:hypothetical protein